MKSATLNLTLICILMTTLVACAGTPQVMLPQNRKMLPDYVEGVFPTTWIPQLEFAYEDFLKSEDRKIECFTAYLAWWNGSYEINFIPNMKLATLEQQKTIIRQEDCGRGVNYKFDKAGKYIGKHYTR